MKKILLSLFLCLTLGTAAAWAADLQMAYTIDLTTKSVSTTAMSTSNFLGTVTGAQEYVSRVTTCAYVYPQGADGIKFASSKQNGTLAITLKDDYCLVVKEIVINAQGSKAGTTLDVTVGGQKETFNLENQKNTDNVITFDVPTEISTINLEGKSGKQIYVKSITVYTEKVATAPEAITATIDGEAIEAEQTVANGTVVTFESKNAGALKINGETVENPYDYTVNFGDAKTLEVTVEAVPAEDYTPAEGEEMPVATYTFVREAAAECGAVEFNIEGGAVYEGTTIFLSCENAATIMYAINGGAEKEYNAEAGITISEACTIAAYGINGDGVHGETAEYSFTIKEADRYKLITSIAELKSGAKYIIVSANGKGMGTTISSSKFSAASGTFTAVNNIITPGEDSGINVLVITVSGTGYKLYAEGNNAYLNATLSSTNLNTTKDGAIFDITFTAKGCAEIGVGTRQIIYNGSVFGNYADSNADASGYYRSYLYRLIDEDYVAAPESLYLHGDFYDVSWERSIEMERSGDVFTLTDIMIGHPDGGQHYLFATFPKANPNESTTEQVRRKAAVAQDYWSDNEGHVYIPNGDGTATRLHTSEINGDITPAEVEKRGGYYDLTADFSGFTPTFSISEAKDITTGAAAVEADANAPVEYFNLQGIRVENPENGLYIRRQGSNTTKVYIR